MSEILPREVLDEIRQTARPERFGQASRALAAAVAALAEDEGELAVEAGRAAKEMAPRSPAAREALGLGLYQVGAFREARTELAAAQRMTGENAADLAAVLADIERALGRPERAVEIFEHTDRKKLSNDAAAELLLVAASAYGDLGKPASGAALIRRHGAWPGQLEEHHLRLSYAQAKLAQEAGDLDAARRAYERVVAADPDFYDATERLDALGNPGAGSEASRAGEPAATGSAAVAVRDEDAADPVAPGRAAAAGQDDAARAGLADGEAALGAPDPRAGAGEGRAATAEARDAAPAVVTLDEAGGTPAGGDNERVIERESGVGDPAAADDAAREAADPGLEGVPGQS